MPLKNLINIYNPVIEITKQTRVQSDPTILRSSKSDKLKPSILSSETEICSILMSNDENSSTFFNCCSTLKPQSNHCKISNENQKCLDDRTFEIVTNPSNDENNQKVECEGDIECFQKRIITLCDFDEISINVISDTMNATTPGDDDAKVFQTNDLPQRDFISKFTSEVPKCITEEIFQNNLGTSEMNLHVTKFIQSPTIVVYSLTKTEQDTNNRSLLSLNNPTPPSNIEPPETTIQSQPEQFDLNTDSSKDLLASRTHDNSYSSLELSYDSTISEVDTTFIEAEIDSEYVETKKGYDVKEIHTPNQISNQLETINSEELLSTVLDCPTLSDVTIKEEKPNKLMVTCKKNSRQKTKTASSSKPKVSEKGKRPPPRKTIRYPKDEKYHEDGYILEYKRKLTMKNASSNDATTSLKGNAK